MQCWPSKRHQVSSGFEPRTSLNGGNKDYILTSHWTEAPETSLATWRSFVRCPEDSMSDNINPEFKELILGLGFQLGHGQFEDAEKIQKS